MIFKAKISSPSVADGFKRRETGRPHKIPGALGLFWRGVKTSFTQGRIHCTKLAKKGLFQYNFNSPTSVWESDRLPFCRSLCDPCNSSHFLAPPAVEPLLFAGQVMSVKKGDKDRGGGGVDISPASVSKSRRLH